MNKTTKSTASKYIATGSNSPVTREASTVVIECLVSPLTATDLPTTQVKSTLHKKKERVEDCKTRKAIVATTNSAMTNTVKVLPKVGDRLTGICVTVSAGSTMINCIDGTVSLVTPILVPVYNSTGKVVAMLQVPDNLPTLSISADIPIWKTERCCSIWNNLQSALEDSEAEDYSEESEQGSDEEGGHPTEQKLR